MAKIRVTPEELLAVREELESLMGGLNASCSELWKALFLMQASFGFGGSDSAGKKREKLREELEKSVQALDAQTEKLVLIAENYDSAERRNADEDAADG